MFAFKASLVRFTLRQVDSFVQNYLLEKSAVHKNFCCWSYFGLKDLHEFIFAGGTIGNKFVLKFKMSLWEKMLLSIKTAHFNFTLIRLNNKSSPQFIRLNGKVSAEQSNCSLVDPRGTRKAIFLSECNANISPHLSTDHLSKCGDVTEAELIMTS